MERRARLTRQREKDLAASLLWLPGVANARVHLGRQDGRLTSAACVLRPERAGGLSDDTKAQARALLSQAVPGSTQVSISIGAAATPAPEPVTPLQAVGPFQVVAADAPTLRAALVALLMGNGLMAGAILWLRRSRL